jgi:hypothetical protein
MNKNVDDLNEKYTTEIFELQDMNQKYKELQD